MIYELRTYDVMPGRMPILLKRFEDHTLRLFEKHGIKQAGFFTTVVGESHLNLIYLLRWESMAERESKMPAMDQDPEWIGLQAETGPLVNRITNQLLKPTSFSAIQ